VTWHKDYLYTWVCRSHKTFTKPTTCSFLRMMLLPLPGTRNFLAHSAVTMSMKTKPRTMFKSVIIRKNVSLLLLLLFRVSLIERILYGRACIYYWSTNFKDAVIRFVCKTDHVFVIIWEFDVIFICQLRWVCAGVGFFPPSFWSAAAVQQTLDTPRLSTTGTQTERL